MHENLINRLQTACKAQFEARVELNLCDEAYYGF